MNKYYIRTIPSDWSTLLKLGEKLGAIVLNYETEQQTDEDGNVTTINVGEPTISATQGGAWDFIGEIYKPTGELDSEGNPIMTAVKNPEGIAYWHANLITPLALGELASQTQGTDEETAQGLANLTKFFLLDEQGNARAPAEPARVFAGMGV